MQLDRVVIGHVSECDLQTGEMIQRVENGRGYLSDLQKKPRYEPEKKCKL